VPVCDDRLVDSGAVSAAIKYVAARQVTSRFGALVQSDVTEKSPGEVVTEADRACEIALTAELKRIRDIPVIGEEAAAAEASLTELIRTSDAVWALDPLDGTSNFVAGSTDHSVMVALVEHGSTVASWMWHPVTEVMAYARLGGGAWFNDERVLAPLPTRDASSLRGVLKKRFLPDEIRRRVEGDNGVLNAATEGRNCAGLDYPDLARGSVDFLVYWRTLPWDHAPGVLFAQEAGLHAARPDGGPYRPGDDTPGLLVSEPDIWDDIQSALFG
jgi:fructose-1,6-bisphosphatase/inositol monophosphatase family enzyme